MHYKTNEPGIAQMRERAAAYPFGSPVHDAFIQAIVRRAYAEDDARIDALIIRTRQIMSTVK